jgi:Domain of unknown function (DUF4349)
MTLFEWIKRHGVLIVIIIAAVYFVTQLQSTFMGVSQNMLPMIDSSRSSSDSFGNAGVSIPSLGKIGTIPTSEYAPQTDGASRIVIQESSMSILVKDVVETRGKIISYAEGNGGYMVSTTTSNPQDAPSATVVVRVPSTKLDEALNLYRALGVKVVSENLYGRDVTDQYVDIEKRITQLERTLTQYENLLERATLVTDITNITQQIMYTQSQIDSLVGQQDALSKNAQLSKLTIYLSTDEIALPYTPDESFRPGVIFKLAVRSMVGSLRGLASFAIWAGVYSVIWVPAVIVYIILKKWWKRKNETK